MVISFFFSGGKKARAEVVVMNEKEAKARNGSEAGIEKGKRAKVVKGSEVEAKRGDEAAQEVEIADSEAATEVLSTLTIIMIWFEGHCLNIQKGI